MVGERGRIHHSGLGKNRGVRRAPDIFKKNVKEGNEEK